MRLNKKRIYQELARQKMTVAQLAEHCGKCRAWVSTIINGKTIAPKTAGAIASALGVDITEILEDEE